jgi:hypothetical protein
MNVGAPQVEDEAQISFLLGTPEKPNEYGGSKIILSIHSDQFSTGKDNKITFVQDEEHSKIALLVRNSINDLVEHRKAYACTDDIRQDEKAQLFINKLMRFHQGGFAKVKITTVDKDGNDNFLLLEKDAIIYKDSIEYLWKSRNIKNTNQVEEGIKKGFPAESGFSWKTWIIPTFSIGFTAIICLWYLRYKK